MAQKVVAPGKLEAGAKDIIPTDSLQDEAVTTAKQSAAAKIKRAVGNKMDTNVQHAATALIYTTTPVTVTKAVLYAATIILAGNLVVDVGINGDDNAIVDGAAISDKANDSVTELTIAAGAVAAGKIVTATVKTASGDASQLCLVAIEYEENE